MLQWPLMPAARPLQLANINHVVKNEADEEQSRRQYIFFLISVMGKCTGSELSKCWVPRSRSCVDIAKRSVVGSHAPLHSHATCMTGTVIILPRMHAKHSGIYVCASRTVASITASCNGELQAKQEKNAAEEEEESVYQDTLHLHLFRSFRCSLSPFNRVAAAARPSTTDPAQMKRDINHVRSRWIDARMRTLQARSM